MKIKTQALDFFKENEMTNNPITISTSHLTVTLALSMPNPQERGVPSPVAPRLRVMASWSDEAARALNVKASSPIALLGTKDVDWEGTKYWSCGWREIPNDDVFALVQKIRAEVDTESVRAAAAIAAREEALAAHARREERLITALNNAA